MQIRQIALVARELEPVVEDLCAVLGLEVAFRDPGVATFGLHNAVLPVGDQFLEVVSPVEADTSAGRLLERRNGDGGYMVILQTDDLEAHRARLKDVGVRVVWEIAFDDIATIHLHPRDVGAAILSLDWADPPDSWRWAGPEWRERRGTGRSRGIERVELQGEDPSALAASWARALDRPLDPAGDDAPTLALDNGRLDFVPARDGRGDGLAAVTIRVDRVDDVLAEARARGLPCGPAHVTIAGTRFDLVA